MPDGLYESDALAWADRQSALLRRLARGERVNDAVDWPHVIEEVQDVGLSELRACQSLLEQALAHLLKSYVLPESQAVPHWRDEIRAFLHDVQRRFTPSMRQRLDLDALYDKAAERALAAAADFGVPPPRLPQHCPFTLDQLLATRPDLPAMLDTLRAAAPRPGEER
ncbi:MAG: DUF29 domain-containing protein [Acidisphaera sp.]|nr:DUF29 domain-containing protein [Acidisphaera sp.]MBV9813645.1 DUF29 domain-containing protein [Acetobacteraceae bacterium]